MSRSTSMHGYAHVVYMYDCASFYIRMHLSELNAFVVARCIATPTVNRHVFMHLFLVSMSIYMRGGSSVCQRSVWDMHSNHSVNVVPFAI